MINEQRALATLDLALKNAFETLDKYSLWVRTPEDSVTFNLVDAVPTLESNGTGIFLKPITVPSFAAVRSTIFGPQGTTAERPLYWNLRFKAVNGWTFEKNQSTDPTKLTVLVNTFFGSNDVPVTVTNTNVTENLVSSQLILDENSLIDFNNGVFRVAGDSFNAALSDVSIGTSGGRSKILGTNIVIGSGNSAYSALTYAYSKNNLNVEKNSITLGPTTTTKQSTYSMVLRSGSLAVDLVEGKNFQLKMRNSTGSKSLLSAVFSNGGYDVDFIQDGFKANRLYVGDVKDLKVTASDSIQLLNDYGSLIFTQDLASIFGDVLKISSKTSTSIGSKASVNIGIEDALGVISKEIVVTKGSVVIPNLYVQKKANYQLSGVKHVSKNLINPSVVYYPDSVAKTLSDSTFGFEYTKNIKSQLIEETSGDNFATTINDLSGATNAYLVRLVDGGLEYLKADATSDGTDTVVTSKFLVVTGVTGLSGIKPYVFSPQLKMISTPNGMYILVRELISGKHYYNVYFSSNGNDFNSTPLHSYEISSDSIYGVSIDYLTVDAIDYIWFTHSRYFGGTTHWWCEYDFRYTYVLFYLKNDCSQVNPVTDALVYNPTAAQIIAGNGSLGGAPNNYYALYGTGHKVVVYSDGNGASYALILGMYGGEWHTVTRSKKDLADYLGGGYTTTTGPTQYAHGVFLRKYTNKYNYIEQTDVASFPTDGGNGPSFLANGEIVDFDWNGTVGNAILSSNGSTKRISFNGSKETGVALVTNARTKYSQTLYSVADTKLLNKLLVNTSDATKAFTCSTHNNTVYSLNATLAESVYGTVLSSLGIIYYDWVTASIIYYDNGTDGVDRDIIEVVINKSTPNESYDLSGAIVDYIGVNYAEFGSFYTGFVLSTESGGDFLISNTTDLVDRRVYTEQYNGDIISLIESNGTTFTPSKISSRISGKYNKAKSILVSVSNIYHSVANANEQTPVVSSYSSDSLLGALNFHIEPISYLVKNRLNSISSYELGNYTINSTSVAGLFVITQTDNKFSGYRVPYYTDRTGSVGTVTTQQIQHSNQSTAAPDSSDMNSSLKMFYVTIDSGYCHVHDNLIIGNSTVIVSIPFGLIDPTDATFDPLCGIVNEFNNVVSIKLPYMFAVRSRNCGIAYNRGRSNLVLGLTEVAEIGGDC